MANAENAESWTCLIHFPDGTEAVGDVDSCNALAGNGVLTITDHQWIWRITRSIRKPRTLDGGLTIDAEIWVEPAE